MRTYGNAISTDAAEDPWDFVLRQVNAKFEDNGQPDQPLIALTYEMNKSREPTNGGDEELRIKVRHNDCTSDVDSQVIAFNNIVKSSSGLQASSDNELLWDVNLSLFTNNVMSDTKLVTGTNDDFQVRMCVRAEFINKFNNQEAMIAYDETNVNVDVVLATSFDDLFITARADAKREVGGDVDVEFSVNACLCNENYDCTTEDRHPNQMLRICTSTVDSRVELMDIRTMQFYQDDAWRHTAVEDRQADQLTAVNKFSTQKNNKQMTVVETTALPAFFENPSPSSGSDPTRIEVKGTALLRFVGSGRRLEDDPEVAGEGEFLVSINLDPTELDAAAPSMATALALFLSTVALIFTL
ncbi:MAG: hypothetical protein SGILL_007893 [Bacillariaceae sp.]